MYVNLCAARITRLFVFHRCTRVLFFFFLCALAQISVRAADHHKWCYDRQNKTCGPAHWHEWYSSCGGKKQSPIEIHTSKVKRKAELKEFVFHGHNEEMKGVKVTNNGHTIKLSFEDEITMKGGGLSSTYRAVELHFHWGNSSHPGSEHTINGKRFNVEMHVVHYDIKYKNIKEAKAKADGLAVLAFFYNEGEENVGFNAIVNALNGVRHEGQENKMLSTFKLNQLLPPMENLKQFYRYDGSLTTPTCDEVVTWTVFELPSTLSKSQLAKFLTLNIGGISTTDPPKVMVNNYRPTQKRSSRPVYASPSATGASARPVVFLGSAGRTSVAFLILLLLFW
uniref:Carbonic anhydrase n=1 Tax=Eptatretus stoutii TaxID=7765 RepID=B6DS34_EPTST|nr:carbonic anhydrase XV-like protein [Eptatretus stoutii]